MTPAELNALRAAIRARADCSALRAARDLDGLAELISTNRKRLVSRSITERGVRAVLPITQGNRFLAMLKELAEPVRPLWLPGLLRQAGIPDDEADDYADTLACAYGWLKQEAGLDIGSERARQMLDLLALAPGGHAAAVATLKALAEEPAPVSRDDINAALFNPDGTEK